MESGREARSRAARTSAKGGSGGSGGIDGIDGACRSENFSSSSTGRWEHPPGYDFGCCPHLESGLDRLPANSTQSIARPRIKPDGRPTGAENPPNDAERTRRNCHRGVLEQLGPLSSQGRTPYIAL